MRKIIGLIIGSSLSLTMVIGSLSCASGSTTTPPGTTPPGTTIPITTTPTKPMGQSLAENFILNSSTFKFDGIKDSLALAKDLSLSQSQAGIEAYTFGFKTAHPGHGDRTGQVLAQVITNHSVTIRVDIIQNKVTEAICDEVYDMLQDKPIQPAIPAALHALALDYVKNSSTFKFDGVIESLKVIQGVPEEKQSADQGFIFTIGFQTRHAGHGDRTGQYLLQVITNHTAQVIVRGGKVVSAICDGNYDMLAEKSIASTVNGIVISGGDTTPKDGPMDAPRVFVYKVQKDDGTFVLVSYTAYPPSPVGDAKREKIYLGFRGGSIQFGDYLQAHGTYSAETNTLTVSNQGDYIVTFLTDEAARKLAEQFVLDSSTFKFDGLSGSLKYIQTDPGWTSSFRSTSFTFEFKTGHPGHGDRTGQVLAQVITDHTVVVLVHIEKGTVMSAVCDKSWDMIGQKDLPVYVSGIVISGGDTTPADGPQDGPRVFLYRVKKADGTMVNVGYTAYPPSPAGDANRAKITLEFYNGSIAIGDQLEALGMLDKTTNTVQVADTGNYIRTSVPRMQIVGKIISGGDTTSPDGPLDAPRKFVFKLQKDDGTYINVSYTAYPPSPAGDIANAKITVTYYNGKPVPGDYMMAYGTYNLKTDTVIVASEGDFIKTYPVHP